MTLFTPMEFIYKPNGEINVKCADLILYFIESQRVSQLLDNKIYNILY